MAANDIYSMRRSKPLAREFVFSAFTIIIFNGAAAIRNGVRPKFGILIL